MKKLKLEQIVGLNEAKSVITNDLRLRVVKTYPMKMTLLEGSSGCGKTTFVEAVIDYFKEKHPDRFEYMEVTTTDISAHVTSTAEKISEFFIRLRIPTDKVTIIFLDEVDELLASRKGSGHIRGERTTNFIRELNKPIDNLYIICATNRPAMIDRVMLDRFNERVNCPPPTDKELKELFLLHLDFLSQEQIDSLYKYMTTKIPDEKHPGKEKSKYKWNGRDIEHLGERLVTLRDVNRLDTPDYELSVLDLVNTFESLVNSKKHLRDDYLDDENDEEIEPPKRTYKPRKPKELSKEMKKELSELTIPDFKNPDVILPQNGA